MTIEELRDQWTVELTRCESAIKMFEASPEYVEGVRHNIPVAIVTKHYIERLEIWRAQLIDLLSRYGIAGPVEGQINA